MSAIIPSDANKPSLIIEMTKEISSKTPKPLERIEGETNNSSPIPIPSLAIANNSIVNIDPATAAESVSSVTDPSEKTSASPSRQLLNAAVSEMNDFVQSIQRELQFTVDEDSGRTVVKVIDKATNEVIRQVPPEDLMAMLKEFSKPAQPGLIFKNSA